jgi:hypothetical protein
MAKNATTTMMRSYLLLGGLLLGLILGLGILLGCVLGSLVLLLLSAKRNPVE